VSIRRSRSRPAGRAPQPGRELGPRIAFGNVQLRLREALGRLCCIWSTGGMPKPLRAEGSDRQSQLLERGGNSKACWLLDLEFVVAAPKVLHQGMPGQHDRGTAVLFEPAHRS
jgi:hypothetical protein